MEKLNKMDNDVLAAIKAKNSVHHFRLFVACPKCKDEPHYWSHASCNTTAYINDEGFLLCENSKKPLSKCKKFFIQNGAFNCGSKEHGVGYSSYESLSDFLQAMSLAVASIENSTSDMSKLQGFIQRLTQNLGKNWKFC